VSKHVENMCSLNIHKQRSFDKSGSKHFAKHANLTILAESKHFADMRGAS